ncbi:SOS response-associated peptidase [Pseudalkalibacillus berkeleyi]|uniref:Abasic site processing protein n=1 Tax=Pseudalkalibacillus berkeleyi TaxID=1069813 RepID=A0ABS9H5U2_9BACL|nr:SOS response-associated peptidase [Pseudalkalibacillus berkeleyi]MCF6139319.1 SOS response-associated peptidase [Pseudalkalibacillus berkeleyi]
MCGRFTLTAEIDLLMDWFEIDEFASEFNIQPRFNIAPSQDIVAIVSNEGSRRAGFLKWGLIPFWAKDPSIGHKLINARSETVPEKPSFKHAFKKRRCIIPADGFFEWKKEGKHKQPKYIKMKNDQPFGFAGLWEKWKDEQGNPIHTCTVLTTEPNELMEDIHNRMPVILPREKYGNWLDVDGEQSDLIELMKPFDSASMTAYNVSTIVNSPRNEVPECIEEL